MKCHYETGSIDLISRFRWVASALILVGAAFVVSSIAFGQGATGAITGTVTDTTGAVIPNAKLVLLNTATGAERTALTNGTGNYVFPEVIPGTYTIQVSAEGFTTAK